MTFDDYQVEAYRFAKYPTDALLTEDRNAGYVRTYYMEWLYPALAVSEEAGEVSGKLAKFVRKQDYSDEAVTKLKEDVSKELGDLLWQLSALAEELGLSLNHIACDNIDKLRDRESRGVIVGEGDNR